MQATLQLPGALAHRLEELAEEEGTSLDALLRLLVSEHLERRQRTARHRLAARREVHFPLISKDETGVIQPVTGMEIDEIFALDDLAS
jgi:hypothetical protein